MSTPASTNDRNGAQGATSEVGRELPSPAVDPDLTVRALDTGHENYGSGRSLAHAFGPSAFDIASHCARCGRRQRDGHSARHNARAIQVRAGAWYGVVPRGRTAILVHSGSGRAGINALGAVPPLRVPRAAQAKCCAGADLAVETGCRPP